VIRAFGPFLVAINLTISGTQFPHRLRWSHPAAPGSLPTSWDVTDPTVDAGEIDFPDVQSGLLTDILPLGPTMFVYKDSSVWKMRFTGGQQIFDFGQSAWLNTAGLLGPICISRRWYEHIGNRMILSGMMGIRLNRVEFEAEEEIARQIDSANFAQGFIFANPSQ
jgi:hypothetical protein